MKVVKVASLDESMPLRRGKRQEGRWLALLVGIACALLSGCELTPSGGSLYHASMEIGNTYTLDWPRRVYGCQTLFTTCLSRESGNFTIDNAAVRREGYVAAVHLVFDDGYAGWMRYNDFLGQQFTQPVRTRLVVRLGMTADQIRSSWGTPAVISLVPVGTPRERWTYPTIGDLYFKDGKIDDVDLAKSLMAAN